MSSGFMTEVRDPHRGLQARLVAVPRRDAFAISIYGPTDVAAAEILAFGLRCLEFGAPATRCDLADVLTSPRDAVSVLTAAGRNHAELATQLEARVAAGLIRRGDGRLTMMFTGQGSQRVGMGHVFFETIPAFRQAFDEVCEKFLPLIGVDVREIAWGPHASEDELRNTSFAQPAIFGLGYALERMWRQFGVQPSWLLGHSIGELTAACAARVLSLSDAARLVSVRARHMGSLPAGGAMAATRASIADLEVELLTVPEVCIAAINGRTNVVLSGPADAIDKVCSRLERRGMPCQRLPVSHAFHSHLVDPILSTFLADISDLVFERPHLPLLSNVTGDFHGDQPVDAAYWVRHIREPVRFADCVNRVAAEGGALFLELGATPTLTPLTRRELGRRNAIVLGPDDHEDAVAHICRVAAELHDAGHPIRWDRLLLQVSSSASLEQLSA